MPMTWDNQANAKFTCGILEQLKEHKVRLNYQKLAEHMGPECTRKMVDNQITKLRKVAAQPSTSNADANGNVNNNGVESDTGPSTPAATPKKRRYIAKAGTVAGTGSPMKKAKGSENDEFRAEVDDADIDNQDTLFGI